MDNPQVRRKQILKEMGKIDRMEKGRLSAEYRERVRDGKTVRRGPYYKYQRWEGGQNISRQVPEDEAEGLRQAVEGYHRFQALAEEYAKITVEMTRHSADDKQSKKKPR